LTWVRAQKMSVPSANSKVIKVTEKRVAERICTRLGMPRMAISIGQVTRRSSSSGGRPGSRIETRTCAGATSGKASIDSFCKALAHQAAKPSAPSRTSRRWRSATPTRPDNMRLLRIGLGELGQQGNQATDGDLVGRRQRGTDRGIAGILGQHFDGLGTRAL